MLNISQGKNKPQGAIFPLAIWETVNFLQPPAMKLPTSLHRVSPTTISTLEELAPIEKYLKFYDREYWDPLSHDPNDPGVGGFTRKQQKIIIGEFF